MFFRKKGDKALDIKTERLLIRSWEEKDRKDFEAIYGDPEVMELSGGKPHTTQEEFDKTFSRLLKNINCYAIVLKEEDKVIGTINYQEDFRRYKINSISIGYEMARAYWGKGYMTEALKAMIRNAFDVRGVDIIGIAHFTVNTGSRRVIEKCGFHHEGTLPMAFKRYDGVVFDDESYSMTKEYYLKNKESFK